MIYAGVKFAYCTDIVSQVKTRNTQKKDTTYLL